MKLERDRTTIIEAINRAFGILGFTPRDNQAKTCLEIIQSFYDEDYQYVVLNAPTGSGKSIIGAVVSLAMSDLDSDTVSDDYHNLSSISLMHQNILIHQYDETFEGTSHKVLLGSENYGCGVLSSMNKENPTADHCVRNVVAKTQKTDLLQICNNECEYMQSRKWLRSAGHIITNYAYYFTMKTFKRTSMPARYLSVLDEAHMMNDVYVNFATISTNPIQLRTLLTELAPFSRMKDIRFQVSEAINKLTHLPMVSDQEVNTKACDDLLAMLEKIYHEVTEFFKEMAEEYANESTLKEYTELSKIGKKYGDKLGRIENLRTFQYKPSYSYNSEKSELEVKPLFMESMFDSMFGGSRVLFMSATISDLLISKTCNIPINKIKLINMDSLFPKENKEIIFFDLLNMNYSSLQNKDNLQRICDNVQSIVECHALTEKQKGIVLVPSFKLCQLISNQLQNNLSGAGLAVFEHTQGTKIANTLEAFKAFKGQDGAVLISPSIFEGVDLPDDLSRFQVLVKVPFASLGDARIRMILKDYPEIYNLMAIMKIIQGCGRSVRSKEDYASTYVLDLNIKRLWFSSANVWRNQFLLKD